ncbi:hypothetical protein N483_17430 [Pseudoalteromonas luteoviolacea NCIMB 1944]|nr:hypothetical protein N483_17430 [Pseudoalteromonas luteoviolacea NCIMB 1944]
MKNCNFINLNQPMPIQSKYSNEQVEQIVDSLINVLQEHKAPVDLSLMCLGNSITHILKEHVPESKRQDVADNFAKALTQSVK